MKITKIEINQYKSIQEPLTVHFFDQFPTILIGKNGSGKTNILEALELILSVNGSSPFQQPKQFPLYKIFFRFSKEEVKQLFPESRPSKEFYNVVAFNSENSAKLSFLESEYIIPLLKKEVMDSRDIANKLLKALENYENQLARICGISNESFREMYYQSTNPLGYTTNYLILKKRIEQAISLVKESTKYILTRFYKKDQNCNKILSITEIDAYYSSYLLPKDFSFELKYSRPVLPPFEREFIFIDEKAIQSEIEKINHTTEDSIKTINECLEGLKSRIPRILTALHTQYSQANEDNCSSPFLQELLDLLQKKCTFLKNENSTLLFQDQENFFDPYRQLRYSHLLLETYLKKVYSGTDKEDLLYQMTASDFSLPANAAKDFEVYLNRMLPAFEKNMYEKISVEQIQNTFNIFLHEKTGDIINFNTTSSGRRWYFTYYFMKSTLQPGDFFLIDEPAAMLHPLAQKDILKEILELKQQGIAVIYSTHSPYLIPKDWRSTHFVSMAENGTTTTIIEKQTDYSDCIKQISDNDIFDLQSIVDQYTQCPKDILAPNCYRKIKEKFGSDIETATKLFLISDNTMDSWKKRRRKPQFENVVKIATITETDIKDLFVTEK